MQLKRLTKYLEVVANDGRSVARYGTATYTFWHKGRAGFNAQECTNKTLTTIPFKNTCKADEVSPKVEAGVVVGLQCVKP
jgi:hypothetical protein